MRNLHFVGHRIVASEFLIPTVDFACPLPRSMFLATLHPSLSSVFCVCVCVCVCVGGGGGVAVLSRVEGRRGEENCK